MRAKLQKIIETKWFTHLVIVAILTNAVTLGLETSRSLMEQYGDLFQAIDLAFIIFFVIELVLKLSAYRWRFFRDGWNVFDFLIVVLTLLPFLGNLSVLRALRILRVLRLLSVVPRFRMVVQGFLDSLSGLVAVGSILVIILYISAVLASKLFGDTFPELFGTLSKAFLVMFQLMTLDGWTSEIVRPVMTIYPYAWIFFVPYIAVTTFVLFNLLIGIIVNSMQHIYAREEAETRRQIAQEESVERSLLVKIEALEDQLTEMKEILKTRS